MIGIVCFNSLRYYQFLFKYTNILDKHGIEYEVIFWNREGIEIDKESNWIHFDLRVNTFQPFYKKIYSFCKYVSFLRKKIKEKKYNKLIVLTSQTAIPLIDILLRKYSGNYIFDYRDITYENLMFYKKMINKIIEKSYFTAISSKGFLNVIASNDKLIISHNCRSFKLNDCVIKENNPIIVAFWGMVRQLNINYKICDVFATDKRFELIYHGAGFHEELKKYCREKRYSNIKITGKYDLSEIKMFAKETDLLLNVYENDKTQKYAMTVKFYDSLQYGIPMIVNKNSYMANIVEEYKLGFVIDINEADVLNRLYDNFLNFDYELYEKNRKIFYEKINDDDIYFEKKLINYVTEELTNEEN